jgi:hypothetical protein
VQLHQVLDQREAYAQAALGAVQRLVALGEQVEDVRQEFGLDAGCPLSFTVMQFAVAVQPRFQP